jgi:hypothetical protein
VLQAPEQDLDALVDRIDAQMTQLEQCKVEKIDMCYYVMAQVAFPTIEDVLALDINDTSLLDPGIMMVMVMVVVVATSTF